MVIDEALERRLVAAARDSEERGFVGPAQMCLLDRGGFALTNRSSGCPKPQHHRLTGSRRAPERSAADEFGCELKRVRNVVLDVGRR